MASNPFTFTVTLTFTLTSQQVADLITLAVEGGSPYWCKSFYLESIHPEVKLKPWYADPNLYDQAFEIHAQPYDDPKTYRLTPVEVQAALEVMAKDLPHTLRNIIDNDLYTNDADAFLQLCLFGKVVYG